MHQPPLLQDLAVVMLVAAVVTVVCHRLRLPVILGYILAGLIVGPHTPPFPLITDAANINNLSQLGVVMLMFTLGLDFSLRGLARVGPTAFIAATLEMGLMIFIGFLLGRAFGWTNMDSVFLGAMLLSSSTIIIAKTLNDLGLTREPFAKFIYGILVFDDMAAILALGVLSGVAISGSFSPARLLGLSTFIGLFLVVAVVLGLLIMPRLLRYIARFRNDEVMLVAVLGMGFGMAIAAVQMGFSAALGAFVIGAVIAETSEGTRIKALVAPVRDMFSAIFFVSVGLMLDPESLLLNWKAVLLITLVLIVGKTLTGALGAFVAGNDTRTSLRVGMGLAQIGEFAFIIAALGRELKVTSDFLYPVAVAVSGITTVTTPVLIRNSDRLASLMEAAAPRGLRNLTAFYARWVASLQRPRSQADFVREMLWRWGLQILLNLALITALFLVAVAVAERIEGMLLPAWLGGHSGLLLLATLVLALPMIIAILRKLRAIARLISEVSIRRVNNPEKTAMLRRVMTQIITGGGALLLLIYVLLLSAAMLPSWPVMALLSVSVVLIAIARWRAFVQFYARAQIAVKEPFSAPPLPDDAHAPHGEAPAPAPAMIQSACLETVEISPASPAAGATLRGLALRQATGASVVGIERGQESILNPAADEVILAGDRVLLIGRPHQIAAARPLLAAEPPPPDHARAAAPATL